MKPGGRACGQSRLFLASEHLVHLWRAGADTDTFFMRWRGIGFLFMGYVFIKFQGNVNNFDHSE